MGSVYVATHLGTGRARALKVMQLGLLESEVERARFVQEARIGATIRSAHVVEVLDSGVDEVLGLPYIAMELLEGEDLASYVAREGPRPLAEAKRIAVELGHALGHAHAVGVVHRDLKPENLFLAESHAAGGGRVLKVLDFGIAKVLGDSARTTAGVGTPLWASPEQLMRGHVGPWTDVWAVGLVFFWLLTGRSYWKTVDASGSGNLVEVLQEITSPTMVPSEQRAAELGFALPPALAQWLDRCLSRDPRGRFPDGGTALEAFAALPDGIVRVVVTGTGTSGVGPHSPTAFASVGRTVPLGPPRAQPEPVPHAPPPRPVSAKIPTMMPWDGVRGQDLVPPQSATPPRPPAKSALPWIVAALSGAVLVLALVAWFVYRRHSTGNVFGPREAVQPVPSVSVSVSGPSTVSSEAPTGSPSETPAPGTPGAAPSPHKAPSPAPSNRPGAGPSVQEVSLVVTGGLTAPQVRSRFSLAVARGCYSPMLAKDHSVEGRFVVTVEIGVDGKVVHSTAGGAADPTVTTCVLQVPSSTSYPPAGQPSRVTWTLEVTGTP
jgi:serine/threonine-protein kinase